MNPPRSEAATHPRLPLLTRRPRGSRLGRLALALLGLATPAPGSAQECAYVGNQAIGTVRILGIPDGGDFGVTTLPDCGFGCQLTDLVVTPALEAIVSQFDGSRLWVVDATGASEPTTIGVASAPTDLVLSPDQSRLYVISFGTSEAAVVDVASRSENDRFALPSQARGLAITPAGNQLVTTSRNQNAVFVLSASDGDVVRSGDVGERPLTVALSPNGERAFVAAEDGTLTVIDVASGDSVDTFTIGELPTAVAVAADGETVYVANRGDDTVSVIDLSERAVSTVAVGREPVALALTTTGLLVVANLQGGELSVIDTGNDNTALSPITAGASPFALAVAPCPARTSACVGDCNDNGVVAINELIVGVNISLRLRDVADCPAFDGNESGAVEIAEIIRAVNNSLGSCPS